MPFCEVCKEHYFEINGFGEKRQHKCDPIFECSENGDVSWAEVRAVNYQHAAEKIAEQWDDYDAEGPSDRTISVRKQGETEVKKFHVTAEISTVYSAEEDES
ncbi:MAG TPA: hypothetical protein VE954_43330 [Oligoflexus sp.]|uniref:hypothetical protein n=1 Tax=Oligoflexus sp. TaxID=1971216 RepID=UPI002D6A633F|nr:hypothetical protein [Oligoflexus sp.]HYX39978.1 hypothetical protein [Oligoflexus sp.]